MCLIDRLCNWDFKKFIRVTLFSISSALCIEFTFTKSFSVRRCSIENNHRLNPGALSIYVSVHSIHYLLSVRGYTELCDQLVGWLHVLLPRGYVLQPWAIESGLYYVPQNRLNTVGYKHGWSSWMLAVDCNCIFSYTSCRQALCVYLYKATDVGDLNMPVWGVAQIGVAYIVGVACN